MQKLIKSFLQNINKKSIRFIFYPTFIFTSFFIIIITIFDLIGLPPQIENIIRQKLHEKNFSLRFENIKLGLINGITLENINFSHIINNNYRIDCKAEKIRISLDLLPDFKIKITNIEFIDSLIDISDKELESKISFKNVNASFFLKDNDIEITHLHALCYEIPININGKISNYNSLIKENINTITNNTKSRHETQNTNNDFDKDNNKLFVQHIENIKKLINKNISDSFLEINIKLDAKEPKLISMDMRLKISSLKFNKFSFENLDIKNTITLNMKENFSNIQNKLYFYSKKTRYLDSSINDLSIIAKIAKNKESPELITISGIDINAKSLIKLKGEGKLNIQNQQFETNINADLSDNAIFLSILNSTINLKKFKIQDLEELNLSANISGNYTDISSLTLSSILQAKELKIYDTVIDQINSEINFNNSILTIPHLKLESKDLNANANLTYSLNDKIIYSEIILDGKLPELSIIAELFPSLEKNIKNLPKIEFSSRSGDNSIKTQIFIRLEPELFYLVNSNFVLKNLIYNKNLLDKTNASVLISSDEIIAISDGHIEKNNDYCNFELIYNGSLLSLSTPLPPSLSSKNIKKASRYISFFVYSNSMDTELLKLIPDLQIEWLSFYGPLNAVFNGFIDLDENFNTSIKGNILNANAKIAKLSLNNAQGKIEFNKNILSIEELNSKFYEGNLNANFHYDFQKDSGNLRLNIKNSNFHNILKDIQDNSPDYIGLLSLNLKSNIYSQNSKLLFDGDGSFLLRDCKILNIPILYELVQILKTKYLKKDWAQIDTINADFKLRETTILSEKIKTNGNIIALEGNGYYDWYKDYCDFNVRIIPLQKLPFLKIFSPIFSIIELKYSGEKDNRRWMPTTGLLDNKIIDE